MEQIYEFISLLVEEQLYVLRQVYSNKNEWLVFGGCRPFAFSGDDYQWFVIFIAI